MRNPRPKMAITMGDPAGIGPEIIVKALAHPNIHAICDPVVIGDAKFLERAEKILGTGLRIQRVDDISAGKPLEGAINCLDLNVAPETLNFGELSGLAGHAAFEFIRCAVELALQGKVQAICTAPLNKASLHLGGHPYPGHTELLAEFSGVRDYAMMLSSPQLKVIHATTHQGLVDAIETLRPERVYRVIRLAHEALFASGIPSPRIAVCAINPHSGEQGLFGRGEEEEKIIPAITRATQEGMSVDGPVPADTVFYKAIQGEYDIVVAMYHDQGHIPVKLLGFEAGVNITLGLPFIRTSVDHGTAFDIAGKGLADESSLVEAIIQAVEMLGPVARTTD
ncbi:MAG: 4-hydroxythreonine-4-phosphate dehydrogenase PdxA [Firmicutes bacterium]|nr:4-hydroxythreonine-4-phosphate dehydrogenase PdxA [Bacillota bacterium]